MATASSPVQNQGEETFMYLRRHWLMLLWRITPPLIILAVLVTVVAALTISLPSWQGGVLAGFLALFIPLVIWLLWQTYDWWNDEFILTNQRVIHNERRFIFEERRWEAQISRIQNVAVRIPNLIANLCNVGNVIVETAGFEGKIEFDYIGNPKSVQKKILELRGLPQSAEPITYRVPFYQHALPFGSIREGATITWHKHWFILLRAIGLPLLAVVILVAILVWIGTASRIPIPEQYAGSVQVILVVLLVLVSLFFLWQYADWWNDIYILTENRIIDIRRIPLIYEDRREAYLEQIQDVRFTIPNLLYRILDLGDVFIETAGKAENFLFETVPDPAQVQKEIVARLSAIREQRQRETERAAMQTIFETRKQELVQAVLDEWQRRQAAPGRG